MTRIAIITASGLGDGLIMHIASHNLAKKFAITTFNNHLPGLGKWLSSYDLRKQSELDIHAFDAFILQHDNSAYAKKIKLLNKPVYTLYSTYKESKHGPLQELDFVCNTMKSMGQNICDVVTKWFGSCSIENGLSPPKGLTKNKYPKRIAIHPKSQDPNKNWPMKHFEETAFYLKRNSYDPIFIEKQTHLFSTLEELASFLYESGGFLGNDSGPGHLASCLGLKTIIIGQSNQQRLWRPSWAPSKMITPPKWSSHFRWTRKNWRLFIPTILVKKTIKNHLLTDFNKRNKLSQ